MVKKIVSNSPKFIKNALTNKYVLYLVLIVSIGNILGYIEANDFDALALFMASGFVMSYFSKNMIIILGIAMFFGNCKVCASALNTREGFKEGNTTTRAGKKDTVRQQKDTTLYWVQEGKCTEMQKSAQQTCKKSSAVPNGQGKALCFTCDDWGTKCGTQDKPSRCKKSKSGFTQRSEPKKLDENDNKEVDVNYGAAIDTAFNTLGNVGKNEKGLQNLGDTTRALVDTQTKLFESISGMAPQIMEAKEALESMKMPDMDKMGDLLEKMNSGSLSGLMAK